MTETQYEPTDDEARAIRSLRRLAARWPSTLALFSWSGTLCVVRLAENGDMHREDGRPLVVGESINIRNDGGDPG